MKSNTVNQKSSSKKTAKYLLSNPLLCDTKNKKLQKVKSKNMDRVKNPN
jgi:hypothetical protein